MKDHVNGEVLWALMGMYIIPASATKETATYGVAEGAGHREIL